MLDLTGEKIFIKIDTEGFAHPVLEGARRLLAENACVLQIEIEAFEAEKIETLLGELGYAECGRIEADRYYARA